jgi:transposase
VAGRTLMSLDVRELIRRLRAGESDRAVSRAQRVARKTVTRYREMAEREGWLEGRLPTVETLDRRLRAMMPPSNLPRQPFKAAPYRAVIERLRERGVGMTALYERLREDHGYAGSYSALRRYVIHLEGASAEAFIRIETAPGDEAQVDFGSAGEMVDPKTGELKKAWAFVMTLSHSRHQYVTFVFNQKVSTWLRCHREAFEYFGGVPKKIVLDNLKSAIVKAALHDPVVQRSYRECAEHYGFLVSPCRVRTPEHKGKVESGVKYVKCNFLAGRETMPITQANAKALEWVEGVAGTRIHGTVRWRPLERFVVVEKGALQGLPATAYDMGVWKQAKLHPDCHVVVEAAYYSAPHRLIGRKLWVRTNGREVVIFHDYERVATHPWAPAGVRRTNPAHYPPDKVMFLMATPAYCRRRATEIGEATKAVVEGLLDDRPLDRLRSVQALLRLAEKYGERRLEGACRRALLFDETNYTTIKRILDRGLESDPLPEALSSGKRHYVFARRGSEIFLFEGGTTHGSKGPTDPEAQGVTALGDPGDTGSA